MVVQVFSVKGFRVLTQTVEELPTNGKSQTKGDAFLHGHEHYHAILGLIRW
jgi:hypothetical protein